jgi:hypothetical protein
MTPSTTPTELGALVNADEALVRRGRLVTAVLRVDVGPDAWFLHIEDGRVVATDPVPDEEVRLRLTASREEWEAFWEPHPRPLHHDLMALMRRQVLTVTGDIHLFMSQLRYVKDVLEKPRLRTTEGSAA